VPEIPTVPQVVNQRDPRVGAFGGGNGDGNPIVANEPRNVAEGAGAQIAVNNNNGEENAPAMPPQPGFAVAENPLHQAQAIYDGLFNDIGHYFNYQPPQQHYYQIQQPYHHPQPHVYF
jgi:hypothetical protein